MSNFRILQKISPQGGKTAQILQTEDERKLVITDSNGSSKFIDLKTSDYGKVCKKQ